MRTKKTEPENKLRVNQNFNNSIHNEIIENKRLSDESINLVQTTLFKTFLLRDFEETTCGTLNMFSVQTGEFIQALHKIIAGLRSLRRLKVQYPWCISTIDHKKKA